MFSQDFLEYIQLLNKFSVEYLLIGGMAVNLHGYRRSTGDMNLFVKPSLENHKKLEKVHHHFGMPMGDMQDISNFMDTEKYDVYTFGVSPIQIDILTKCKGIEFDDVYRNALQIDIDEKIYCKVIDYNALITAKKAAGRARDKADIEELQLRNNKS